MNWYLMTTNEPLLGGAAAYAFISPKRRKRADAYTHPAGRREQIATGILERYVLGKTADARAENRYGKPVLFDGRCYSLSHTAGAVALCVDTEEVGIDLELPRPVSDAVARRCFMPEEQAYVLGAPDVARAFTEIFTRKEAVQKARGKGFALPMNSFSVLPMGDTCISTDGATLYLHTEWVDQWCLSLASENRGAWTGRVLTAEEAFPVPPLHAGK